MKKAPASPTACCRGKRDRLADALTLFDESGLIFLPQGQKALNQVTEWSRSGEAGKARQLWVKQPRVPSVFGHAVLEQVLQGHPSPHGFFLEGCLGPQQVSHKLLKNREELATTLLPCPLI